MSTVLKIDQRSACPSRKASWFGAGQPHENFRQILGYSRPQTLRATSRQKIGEGKKEGGSGNRAYYFVQLRWNVSGAN